MQTTTLRRNIPKLQTVCQSVTLLKPRVSPNNGGTKRTPKYGGIKVCMWKNGSMSELEVAPNSSNSETIDLCKRNALPHRINY